MEEPTDHRFISNSSRYSRGGPRSGNLGNVVAMSKLRMLSAALLLALAGCSTGAPDSSTADHDAEEARDVGAPADASGDSPEAREVVTRSEERRVGKECRDRGSTQQSRTK